MRTICLYFQVHQPMRLKKYRFFNIGTDHAYLDDALNRSIMSRIATRCYLPMNNMLLELIKANKKEFKVTFSISGLAIEQFKQYAPQVLDSFKALAKTGCVEFLGETYSHSLSSLTDMEVFKEEVQKHSKLIEAEFGVKPKSFRNTELIYSDEIGDEVAKMGFKSMLAEGAKHILGWKSPNYLYASAKNQKLRLLLRNYKLSDDIAFRFSHMGLTADSFVDTIASEQAAGDVVNLFMDYETFGEHQKENTGIFEFMNAFIGKVVANENLEFATVTQAAKENQPVAVLHTPYAMSWADEERDVTAWLGNDMQNEAFSKIYELKDKIAELDNDDFTKVWKFMQCSDHFYYMATKWLSDGNMHSYFNPFDSAYDAFIIYMNVLSDFQMRIEDALEKKNA